MNVTVRFIIVAVVMVVVTFAFAVYQSVFTLASAEVLSGARNAYLLRLWLTGLVPWIPLIISTAAVVTFSLAVSPYDLGGSGALIPAIRPILWIIVGVGIVFGVWVSLLEPRVQKQIQRMEYRGVVTERAWDDARRFRDMSEFAVAERYVLLYLSVVGSDEEAEAFLEEVRAARSAAARSTRIVAQTTTPRRNEVSGLGVAELLAQAREFYKAGNYFSAHYYASRAVELTDGRSDARAMQAEALNAMERESFAIDDQQTRSLYQQKLDAFQLFQLGASPGGDAVTENAEALISAYFRFQELQERAPGDPDIQRYARLAAEEVEKISFFVDDARLLAGESFSGHTGIVFRNRRSAELTEYIAAERVVQSGAGDFFYGVEVYQEHTDGARHFYAAYAKRIDDNLFFRAIEREPVSGSDEDRIYRPEQLSGTDVEPPGFVPLHFSTEDIVRVSGGRDRYETLTLPELFGLPMLLERLGQPEETALVVVTNRLMHIFGYFILAFLSIAFAWRYRSYYLGRPPIVALLAVPLIPAVLWGLRGLPGLLVSLFVHGVTPMLGSGGVVTVFLVGMALAVVFSITAVARQRIDL